VRWTTPYRIELSDDERSVIEQRARSSNAPYRQVIQARIVLYAAGGMENAEIATRLDSTWSTVALAQHYGVSTRFLDWTRSPSVAAYFAATESFAQPDETESFAIWAFSTFSDAARKGLAFGTKGPKRTSVVVTAPYSSNPNLHAQDGVHLARPATRLQWSEPAERYDFEQHLEKVGAFGKQVGRVALLQFVAPRSTASGTLWYLAKEGFTAARLFPGYGGAARSVIERKFRIRPRVEV